MICPYVVYAKLRISVNDINAYGQIYVSKSYNIKKVEEGNRIRKLNEIIGNVPKCYCDQCNPISSNEKYDRSKNTNG